MCRGRYKHERRPVLINNWEATYFDFNEEKIEKTFVLENPETVAKWTRVYVDLPDAEMQVFLNIITFAEAVLQTK